MSRQTKLAGLGLEVIKRIARPRISRVNYSITTECNHKCLSCNIWEHSNKLNLTLDDTLRLLAENDIMWLSITGGEPSLNPDFGDIVSAASYKCKLVNIITNGQNPNTVYKAVKNALAHSKNMLVVHVSLMGSEAIHDTMVNTTGSYQAVMETIGKLKSLPYSDRLIVGLEHMVSNKNEGEWWHVRNLSKRLGVGLTYVFEMAAGYYYNSSKIIKPAEMPPLDVGINPIDIFKNGYMGRLISGKRLCVAGEYSCFIMPDKNIYPCFFAIPDKPFGNLGVSYGLGYLKQATRQWVKGCRIKCWTPCESYTALMFKPWTML